MLGRSLYLSQDGLMSPSVMFSNRLTEACSVASLSSQVGWIASRYPRAQMDQAKMAVPRSAATIVPLYTAEMRLQRYSPTTYCCRSCFPGSSRGGRRLEEDPQADRCSRFDWTESCYCDY